MRDLCNTYTLVWNIREQYNSVEDFVLRRDCAKCRPLASSKVYYVRFVSLVLTSTQ